MAVKDEIIFGGIVFIRWPESPRPYLRNYYWPYDPKTGKRAKGVGALHREMYKANIGAIPDDCQIHHRDGNPLNNELDNLQCVRISEHRALDTDDEFREMSRTNLVKAQESAKEWHHSPEGRAWHSEHGREAWAKRQPAERVCVQCGKAYQSMARRDSDKFCSPRCRNNWHYANRTYFEERTCAYCGRTFQANKHRRQQHCSHSCSRRARCGAGDSLQLAG
jgi:hypothetical protein